MGASRKLQTEIDRVLKKVNEGVNDFDATWDKVHDTANANLKEKFEGDLKKEIKKLQRYRDQIKTWQQSSEIKDKKVGPSYEQALTDARKLIEREMERFKVCEKEMKTKAFSKEGLGQQPKTDPKERAKSETRDWLNNVVGDLENQIDNFEAELEGISGKKGKTRNPQLTHLETSITRHKAHIMKLELILRLLDNDELCPDQVNDIRYYLEDYIECNQVDFERFSNVDELYVSLPLDKVEALEDTLGTSGFIKAALLSPTQQNDDQGQIDETTSEESTPDMIPNSPPTKSLTAVPLESSLAASVPGTPQGPSSEQAAVFSCSSSASLSESLVCTSNSVKEEDNNTISNCRTSSIIPETGLERDIGRERSNQEFISIPVSLSLVSGILNSEAPGLVSEYDSFRNLPSVDKKTGGNNVTSTHPSHLSSRILLQQVLKVNDVTISNDILNAGEGLAVGERVFWPSISTSECRLQSTATFQNQNEIRGRPEIVPDQREKYLQRLQQVQQQGHGALLSVPLPPVANHQLLSMQQENSIIQQLQNPVYQLSSQFPLILTGPKDVDIGHCKGEELQQHRQKQNIRDIKNVESTKSDNTLKTPHRVTGTTTEGYQLLSEIDCSPGLPLPSSQSSAILSVVGRRSVSDLGAGGDNLSGSSVKTDWFHTLQLLKAALRRLPQPKDSERAERYFPKRPAVTPPSFPQTRADVIQNPALWKKLGSEPQYLETLFFAFYYQQNTYQQYMSAKELKNQSWRYNKKYNTWFLRHAEPEVKTNEYEKGKYIYFDSDVADGWCQKIMDDFIFEYKHLEYELD